MKTSRFIKPSSPTLVLLSLLVTLLITSSLTNAIKKETKKIAKAVVKDLVLRKLTTQHRIMPLPVPIPGKWQVLASLSEKRDKMTQNVIEDLRGLDGGKFNTDRKDHSYLAADLKKLAQAINKGKLVVDRAANRKSSANMNKKASKSKRSEILTTLFNIYKFASQAIKDDMGDNKLILNKLYHDYHNPISQPPIISLNINNKKTLMNKLTYFSKPTDRNTHKLRV